MQFINSFSAFQLIRICFSHSALLIQWTNLLLGGMSFLCLMIALLLWLAAPSSFIELQQPLPEPLPRPHPFAQPSASYAAINGPFLHLTFTPATTQLPNLKKQLQYFGRNGRPDAVKERALLHFSFTGNKQPFSVRSGEKTYFSYRKDLNPKQYHPSPNNEETPFWFIVQEVGSSVNIIVGMRDDSGLEITSPLAHREFSLPEKELAKHGPSTWELNGQRVDGAFLARQKARWYGPDKFMERHGGDEFAFTTGKQKIDFGEGENAYSIFLGPGDAAVWEKERWLVVAPGPDSIGKTLLVVKKVDERLMSMELWEASGNGKLVLNLIRSSEGWQPKSIQQQFKFVGARTHSQFIFELNKERMLLSPQDWLLLTNEGWLKLSHPDEIDAYVDRKWIGYLFVFDGIIKKDEGQFLAGTLFNHSRSDIYPLEIAVNQAIGTQDKEVQKTHEGEDEDESDDDDEDDDDD